MAEGVADPNLRRRATTKDRFAGPAVVLLLVVMVLVISQSAAYSLAGITPMPAFRWTLIALAMAQVLFAGMGVACLVVVNCTDPGSLSLYGLPLEAPVGEGRGPPVLSSDKYKWCWHCRLWRPPLCHHCPTCSRCFLRLDHHCPWVGNCVAACNLHWYWAMVSSFALGMCTVALGIVVFAASRISPGRSPLPWEIAIFVVGGAVALYITCMLGAAIAGGVAQAVRTSSTRAREPTQAGAEAGGTSSAETMARMHEESIGFLKAGRGPPLRWRTH